MPMMLSGTLQNDRVCAHFGAKAFLYVQSLMNQPRERVRERVRVEDARSRGQFEKEEGLCCLKAFFSETLSLCKAFVRELLSLLNAFLYECPTPFTDEQGSIARNIKLMLFKKKRCKITLLRVIPTTMKRLGSEIAETI